MFFYRGGTHDFACATCHGEDGKRIRLQDLPNLTTIEGAQKAYTTWPAYRVSQGELRTFQWRLNDCFRQQRFPELVFGSDASIALTTYLAAQRQRRRVRRTRDQALNGKRRHAKWIYRALARGCRDRVGRRRRHARLRELAGRAGRHRSRGGDAEGVVQGARAGDARSSRPGRDATALQRVCGPRAAASTVETIEKANLATISYPADGKLVGDWKSGEKIAQSGQGFQYSDDPTKPAGANCYACHQLAPQELSYGTIGPSLYHFGKLRGYTDETRKYAWGKIYNAEAFAACSNMPRFGQQHILTEQQIRDVVALLMDPASPVNQ